MRRAVGVGRSRRVRVRLGLCVPGSVSVSRWFIFRVPFRLVLGFVVRLGLELVVRGCVRALVEKRGGRGNQIVKGREESNDRSTHVVVIVALVVVVALAGQGSAGKSNHANNGKDETEEAHCVLCLKAVVGCCLKFVFDSRPEAS